MFKTMLGLQLKDHRRVSVIKNIDLDNDKIPTLAQMNETLRNSRAGSQSQLLMHPDVADMLGQEYKTSHINMFNDTKTLDTSINAWKSTPIIESHNLDAGTEANL